MRKILIFLAICASFSGAQVLNAISILVNNEAITLYQIQSLMRDKKLSKEAAINELIDDRVEESQIKKMGIFVNNYELDSEISKMLSQSGGDIESLKANLQRQNQDYKVFRENFKQNLLKRKLYEAIGSGAKLDYSEEGARKYYDVHFEDFTLYTQIEALIYTSEDESALERLKETGIKGAGVNMLKESLNLNNSDPRLLFFLSRLKEGEFSIVLENGGQNMLYKIVRKSAPESIDFNQIKNEVMNAYVGFQRDNYIKDFFTKARASAQIKYLR